MPINSTYFSIILPTYNRAQTIARTIHSICNQGFAALEIIVVDDGSTDNTEEVVKNISDSRIQYHKTDNNERAVARNYGATLALGMYVNYFDSDDIYLPCLTQLYDFCIKAQEPAVIYGGIQEVDDAGKILRNVDLPFNSFEENIFFNNFLACGSVFVKRTIALQYPFNTNRQLITAEDWELWLRLSAAHTFTHFPGFIFQQVQHSTRSLEMIRMDKAIDRELYFVQAVAENLSIEKRYGKKLTQLFRADRYTFVALMYVIHGEKRKSFSFFQKALASSLRVMTRKRFWAIAKKLMVG